MLSDRTLTHLRALEAESIHIIREVAAEFDNPVMLYSIGKDSAVMLRLAEKAFAPGPLPFPLQHVDTTFKFRDMYALRDQIAADPRFELLVHRNPEAVAQNINPFDHGSQKHTTVWKTEGLKQALALGKFDAAFGGARRDEEKSRAKDWIAASPCWCSTSSPAMISGRFASRSHCRAFSRSAPGAGAAGDGAGRRIGVATSYSFFAMPMGRSI